MLMRQIAPEYPPPAANPLRSCRYQSCGRPQAFLPGGRSPGQISETLVRFVSAEPVMPRLITDPIWGNSLPISQPCRQRPGLYGSPNLDVPSLDRAPSHQPRIAAAVCTLLHTRADYAALRGPSYLSELIADLVRPGTALPTWGRPDADPPVVRALAHDHLHINQIRMPAGYAGRAQITSFGRRG